ncbi:MAG: tRNA pseudouridine(38-40) synthase TruA [Alphaproteobacteria bacterium]|nr:tRNA pseudouridine(38-40) synthase TruA [Alphaproteobacteria bacterium]
MPRYRITIEYDGTSFVGWQTQIGGDAVQDHIERAIKGAAGETVDVKGAGRTDSGVHATGQVAHFDLSKTWDPFRLREALNFHLKPAPVAVIKAEEAADEFDARFSATARHYLYRVLNRRAPAVLERDRVWWVPAELDAEAMHHAAQCLVGHHDFTTFRAVGCQANSPMRTLDTLDVARYGQEVHITASARSFLHNQVRSLVGSLKLVGRGKWSARDLRQALEACDRKACGPVAPSAGLYLVKVDYPDGA